MNTNDAAAANPALTARQADVLAGIRSGHLLKEIGDSLHLSRQRISQIVSQLMEMGLIVEPRRARYLTTFEPHEYSKRPATVEAVRFTGNMSADNIMKWAGTPPVLLDIDPESGQCKAINVHTLEGVMRADLGDWIVKGVAGEFYPVKPDIFTQLYEAVSGD